MGTGFFQGYFLLNRFLIALRRSSFGTFGFFGFFGFFCFGKYFFSTNFQTSGARSISASATVLAC